MGIKTENLRVGQVVKNYIEMCNLLGEKIKSGTRSRYFQHNEWARYFSYDKNGHKYIIKEIFSEPKPRLENRGKCEGSRNNNKGIYAEYIDVLLLQYLKKKQKNSDYKIYTTNNKIAENCGIVNLNYRTALENQGKLYNTVKEQFDLESNVFCMKDVLRIIKTKIREIVKASLDRLKKTKKLDYEVCYLVYEPYISRMPTKEELQLIITAEELTMKEMGVDRKEQIDINETLQKEFRKKVLEKVQQKFQYIKGIYKGFAVVLCEDVIVLDYSERESLKIKFNKIIIKILKEKPQQMKNKTIKQEGVNGWIGARNPFWSKWVFDRMSKNYIQHCFKFIDILVDIQAEHIAPKILRCKNVSIDYRTLKEKEDYKEENEIIEQLIDEIEDR